MSAPVEQKKKKKESKVATLLKSDFIILPDVEAKQAPKPKNVSGVKRSLESRVSSVEASLKKLNEKVEKDHEILMGLVNNTKLLASSTQKIINEHEKRLKFLEPNFQN